MDEDFVIEPETETDGGGLGKGAGGWMKKVIEMGAGGDWSMSAKMSKVLEILHEIRSVDPGEKVVVFSIVGTYSRGPVDMSSLLATWI
jgi:hypothetical protein